MLPHAIAIIQTSFLTLMFLMSLALWLSPQPTKQYAYRSDGRELPQFASTPSTVKMLVKTPNVTEVPKPFFVKRHMADCFSIMQGDAISINFARILGYGRLSEAYFYNLLDNCSDLFREFYFPNQPLSEDEAKFPIAFVIRVNDHFDHAFKLLHSIYSAQNVYCIHVDLKSTTLFYQTLVRLTKCLPNVFLSTKQEGVIWGGFGMLQSALNCFEDLLQSTVNWTYVITLEGHDFPLKTNFDIVHMLKHFGGANDVALKMADPSRYERRHETHFDYQGLPTRIVAIQQWNATMGPIPYNLTIYKGDFQSVLSRDLVNFLLKDKRAVALKHFLKETLIPEEHFWSTIVHNEFLNAPGFYPGRCLHVRKKDYISRYTKWIPEGAKCPGYMQRNWMCIFGMDDLHNLTMRGELFLNKFFFGKDPLAIDCMHEWIFNLTHQSNGKTENKWNISKIVEKDVSNMSAVRFEQWKSMGKNLESFTC